MDTRYQKGGEYKRNMKKYYGKQKGKGQDSNGDGNALNKKNQKR